MDAQSAALIGAGIGAAASITTTGVTAWLQGRRDARRLALELAESRAARLHTDRLAAYDAFSRAVKAVREIDLTGEYEPTEPIWDAVFETSSRCSFLESDAVTGARRRVEQAVIDYLARWMAADEYPTSLDIEEALAVWLRAVKAELGITGPR